MQIRRMLHEPFFPLSSPPPPPPDVSPPLPKYPFDSNPQQPFFPNYPSPPPPPPSASNVPTFPANISSLDYPSSGDSTHGHRSKLLPAILISLLVFSLITFSLAFLFHRRRRRSGRGSGEVSKVGRSPSRSDVAGSGRNRGDGSGRNAAEFLYLGTVVDNARLAVPTPDREAFSAPPPVFKVGSPELQPLPPLTKKKWMRNYGNGTDDSDEEFYSPKGGGSDNASKRKSGFRSEDLYPDSNSTGSGSGSGSDMSSPEKSKSEPPAPPPPPSIRPMTPSPPKRKLPSPSPPLSPIENANERNLRFNFRSPAARFKEVGVDLQNSKILGDNGENVSNNVPPPPPPPPPPVGYWESHVRKPTIVHKASNNNGRHFELKKPVAFSESLELEKNEETTQRPKLKRPVEFSESLELEKNEETTPRPKLKPLHWDKVRASSDRVMVWDQLKSSSFQVNEEMIETLFGCNTSNAPPKDMKSKQQSPVIPSPRLENRVLDPKKSQNIAILLRALNVTKEEVCEALLEGNAESLGTELLETLLKMAPNKEEEMKLKEFKDESPFKLGPAEKFLKAVLDIPFAFKRADALLYIANFDSEVSYLKKSFDTLEAACEELRNSRLFLKLLEAVLKTGNRMNVGTNRGDAHAFKLDTLLKLADVKGTDGKTTLLHFVVQEITRAEGSRLSTSKTQTETTPQNEYKFKKLGLNAVSGLRNELANVKKAAAMDSEVLSSYVSKLASGVRKVSDMSRLDPTTSSLFNESMGAFLRKAEDGIIKVQAQESVALSLVKEITEYFHGNSTREEAHPFRIFMVVRDFLSVLDLVCKDVAKANDESIASSARQFPVPVNPTLPHLFPQIRASRAESSGEESTDESS